MICYDKIICWNYCLLSWGGVRIFLLDVFAPLLDYDLCLEKNDCNKRCSSITLSAVAIGVYFCTANFTYITLFYFIAYVSHSEIYLGYFIFSPWHYEINVSEQSNNRNTY